MVLVIESSPEGQQQKQQQQQELQAVKLEPGSSSRSSSSSDSSRLRPISFVQVWKRMLEKEADEDKRAQMKTRRIRTGHVTVADGSWCPNVPLWVGA